MAGFKYSRIPEEKMEATGTKKPPEESGGLKV